MTAVAMKIHMDQSLPRGVTPLIGDSTHLRLRNYVARGKSLPLMDTVGWASVLSLDSWPFHGRAA